MKSIVAFLYVVLITLLFVEVAVVPVSEAAGTRVVSSSALDPVLWSTCQYERLTKYLHKLAAKYSTISRLFSIGKSVSGRDLWVMVISDRPIDRPLLRPQVKFVGNIIGDSGPTCYILLKLIVSLLEEFQKEGSSERRLVENNEIHILPNMNPDGFSKSIPGTCRGGNGRLNAAGIDLNRDFPDLFNFQEGKLFQPETLSIMQWMESNNFVSSLSFLSGKLVVSYPFDSVPMDRLHMMAGKAHMTPDDDMFVHLATSYVRNVKMAPASRTRNQASTMGSSKSLCPPLGGEFDNGIINGAKWDPASGTMLDYNYEQGTFELMVGILCCRNENKTETLQEMWDINRMAILKFIAETEFGVRGQIIDTETHKPIPRASIIKNYQNHRMNEGIHPMPWRSTEQGEFWRLILPGQYILQVRAEGYEEKSVLFEVTSNEFTKLLVELEKTKSPEKEIPSLNGNEISDVATETRSVNGLREVESSEIDEMGSDSNKFGSHNSESVESSYSVYGNVNLIVTSGSTKFHSCVAELFSVIIFLHLVL